jgi:RimJ/RimL family protein N-acetyltransferase
MRIRRIDQDRDDLGPLGASARESLQAALERGLTHPERCFVAESAEGAIVGVLGFGELDDDKTAMIEMLALRWTIDAVAVAHRLVLAAAELLDERPAALAHIVDMPNAEPEPAGGRTRVMRELGLAVIRTTRRWERPADRPVPAIDDPLTYRSSAEVSRRRLEDAVRRVSEASLDRALRANRRRRGDADDACAHARLLRRLSDGFDGIALAYRCDDTLVGVSAAGHVNAQPVITLIGVVPEHRGHGHAARLLIAATRRCARAFPGIAIRADSDVQNEPMTRCFDNAGYHQFATRTEFRGEA